MPARYCRNWYHDCSSLAKYTAFHDGIEYAAFPADIWRRPATKQEDALLEYAFVHGWERKLQL